MVTHPLDIRHQSIRILEDGVIDALEHIPHRAATLAHLQAEGVVDVTAAVNFGAHIISQYRKLCGNRTGVVSGFRF